MVLLPLPSPAMALLVATTALGPATAPAARPSTHPAASATTAPVQRLPANGGRLGCRPAAAVAPPPPPGAPRPFRCPVEGPLASAFDAPRTRYSPGHRGIDLMSRVGEPVRAPGAGVVTFAGQVAGRPVVTIDHGRGWRTSLEPVSPGVTQGRHVVTGSVIGSVAATPGHCAPHTCLHMGVRRGGSGDGYVDPLRLLRRVEVVLLPLSP